MKIIPLSRLRAEASGPMLQDLLQKGPVKIYSYTPQNPVAVLVPYEQYMKAQEELERLQEWVKGAR
jgi:hypothetical protein